MSQPHNQFARVDLGLPPQMNARPRPIRSMFPGGPGFDNLLLPDFQREYVWEPKQAAAYLNSVLRGVPGGSYLFWRPQLRGVIYVVDGQQRLTTLGAPIKRSDGDINKPHDEVRFSLETMRFAVEPRGKSVHLRLVTYGGLHTRAALEALPRHLQNVVMEVRRRMQDHRTPVITMTECSAEDVAEAFINLNAGGTPFDRGMIEKLLGELA